MAIQTTSFGSKISEGLYLNALRSKMGTFLYTLAGHAGSCTEVDRILCVNNNSIV